MTLKNDGAQFTSQILKAILTAAGNTILALQFYDYYHYLTKGVVATPHTVFHGRSKTLKKVI